MAEKPLLDRDMSMACWQLMCKSEFTGKVWAGGINVKVLLEQMMFKVIELNEVTGEYKARVGALEPLRHKLTEEKGPAREMENERLVRNEENQKEWPRCPGGRLQERRQ